MAKDDKTKRTTLGADIDTSSAMGAYQDALNAQRNIRSNWDIASDISSDVMGGIQEHRAAVQLDEENKLKNLEAHEDQFAKNVAKITENSGSLGEEYYGIATEQAKLLQEEYMNAVRDGDKEAQTKIKMKLQGFSTGVGTLKESLNIAAELKNDGLLSNGRTAEEIKIADICTNPANAVYQDEEWLFKDPSTGQTYTQDDLDKSLGQIDEVTSKAYLDYEMKQNANGMGFVDGNEGASDFNFNRVKTSIADSFIKEDNIMSIMHDDFRKSGESNTFKAHLEEYLRTSGLIESFHDNPKFDTEGGEGIDTEEEMKAVLEAIYNKDDDNYKYDVSKNIVADYLTRKSESKFYGEFKVDGKELTVKERRAIEPNDKETPESFKKRGGILGIWMNSPNAGVVWNEEYKYFSRTGDLDKLIEEEN